MKTNIRTLVTNEALRAFLIAQNTRPVYNKLGFDAKAADLQDDASYRFAIINGRGEFCFAGIGTVSYNSATNVPFEEFLEAVQEKVTPTTFSFSDGDKMVIVRKNGDVTYGCTTVTSPVIEEIINRRKTLLDLWTEKK